MTTAWPVAASGQPYLACLGGSFDPLHMGHLLIAQDVLETFHLDKVWFIPAARNPLKSNGPHVTDDHRWAMLRLATEGDPRFGALDCELTIPPPSYTMDTVQRLRDRYPDRQVLWIIGSDQLPDLPRWHRAIDLARLTEFACLDRPGSTAPPPGPSGWTIHRLTGHPFAISSTEIRQRLNRGLPVDFFLHPRVNQYIQKHRLYGNSAA